MLSGNQDIYLANFTVDMRKAIDGLSIMVANHFDRAPTDGSIYVFLNRKLDKVKLLYWERNGFTLLYKRLEKGRFKLPANISQICRLDMTQLQWLLSGLNFEKTPGHPRLNYTEFS
jgi:transposase